MVESVKGTELAQRPWIFSVDDHLFEDGEAFVNRVPKRLVAECPRLVDHDGGDAWLMDGVPVPVTFGDGMVSWEGDDRPRIRERHIGGTQGHGGMSAYKVSDETPVVVVGSGPAQERRLRGRVRVKEDFRQGVFDLDARVRDMDTDGVWASVLIPSITFGFAAQKLSMIKNPQAALASVRAYNDYLYEEVKGGHPDRFVCSQAPWLRNPAEGAAEIRRNAARGFTAMLFPENPERFGFPSIHTREWDPMFHACQETGTVLNIHLGTGLGAMSVSSDSPLPVGKAAFIVNPAVSAIDWVFSGIMLRFPQLKVSFTEGGIDFVPLVYGRLATLFDDTLDGYWDADITPAEVFLRNFWFAALFDVGAYQFIDTHCPTHGMVETDYPHVDTVWPHSREHLERRVAGLPEEARTRFLYANAAELYRHPTPDYRLRVA
jgi:predicted TIM-barrel fold metal-dependent hydrolase